jgi:hypothetical protein
VITIVEDLPVPGQVHHKVVIDPAIWTGAEGAQSIKQLDRRRTVPEHIEVLIPGVRRQKVTAQELREPVHVLGELVPVPVRAVLVANHRAGQQEAVACHFGLADAGHAAASPRPAQRGWHGRSPRRSGRA